MEDFSQFSFEILVIKWFRFYRKNILFILTFSVLGLILGFVYNNFRVETYKTDAIIYSSYINEERLSQILEDLNVLTQKRSYGVIAKETALSVEQVSKIKSIEFSTVEVSIPSKSSVVESFNQYGQNCLQVEMEVSDAAVIKDMEQGLMTFLDNNKFLNNLVTNRRANIESMIEKIDEQIASLEMEQKRSIEPSDISENLIINNEMNSISKDMIYLLELKANYEEGLSLKGIEIIKPFYVPERPDSKKIIFLAAGLMLGMIMGIGLAILRKVNSMS